jgi:carboxyl-terminal processing protease
MIMFQRQYATAKKAVNKFGIFAIVGLAIAVICFSLGFFVSRMNVFSQILRPISFNAENIDFPAVFEDGMTKELWQIIKQGYLRADAVDPQKMYYGALMGFVAGLEDPYTMFFDPELAKEFEIEIDGSFTGIGAEVGLRDGRITIVTPMVGSPAEKAGLKPGDQVLAIDEKDATVMPLDEAIKLIRGEKGTKVKLMINRDKQPPFEVLIVREEIKVPSAEWKTLNNGFLHLSVNSFNGDTKDLLDKMVRSVDWKKIKGIVLDLRNNPGGRLDSSVDVASLWIDRKVVVKERFADKKVTNYETKGKASLKNVKTVVLVNGGTASGAEILAGALQDYGIVKIVGEKTFGKGSVQTFLKLENGSALKMTVAEWLTPKDRQIDKVGIEPDVKVVLTDEDAKAEKDPQLEKAMELLK